MEASLEKILERFDDKGFFYKIYSADMQIVVKRDIGDAKEPLINISIRDDMFICQVELEEYVMLTKENLKKINSINERLLHAKFYVDEWGKFIAEQPVKLCKTPQQSVEGVCAGIEWLCQAYVAYKDTLEEFELE